MYSIESGIPVPEISNGRTSKKYPVSELKVGDSFFIPAADYGKDDKKAKSLRGSFAVRAKKLGRKLVSMNDDTGIRVWRVL